MGVGGERLHRWLFPGWAGVAAADAGRRRRRRADAFARTGAVVVGRRTYDIGVDLWGDTPFPVPTFVVTHRPHEPRPMTSATFTFVTDGVASAVAQAVTAAGDRDVLVMGGADDRAEAVGAGLVDEITLNLVPVLLHRGERLLDVDGRRDDRAGPHRPRRDRRGHAPHVPRRALTRPVRRGRSPGRSARRRSAARGTCR